MDAHGIRTILIVVPELDFKTRSILLSLSRIAVAKRWTLRFTTESESLERWIRDWQADAVVLTNGAPPRDTSGLISSVQTISINRDLAAQGILSIMPDEAGIGKMAARYLMDRGFVHFAGFGMPHESFSRVRLEAFRKVITDAGLHYSDELANFDPHNPAQDPNPANIGRLLQGLRRPTGLFAACDNWARMVVDVSVRHGINIPEDIAVVGVDNDQLICELSHPPISSIAPPWERFGHEVATYLEQIFAGITLTPRIHLISPGAVITRHSSDFVSVDDPDVSEALRFIRSHRTERTSVADILREVPVNRRRLERACQRYFGRTVAEEIRRVHLDEAKRLLVLTHLSIDDVAARSGFANPTKLSQAFKKAENMSPREYRARNSMR